MLRSKFWSGIRDPLLKNSSRYKFDTVKDFDQLRKEIRAIELELLNSEKPTSIVQHQPISSDSVKLDDILKKIDRMGKRLDTLEKKTPEEAPRTTGNNQFNTGYSRGNRRGNNSRRYGRGNRYQNDRGSNRGVRQPPVRAFMDDMTVTAKTVIEGRWTLEELERMIKWAGMKFKPSKSRSLIVRKGKVQDETFLLAGEKIPTV
ncbi:Hypothetical predicted protein [Mytilus galloprovincialis]|uniref:Uncharacterized protein n=1 Tax=Mytilus galloprovincialis TaxID=29158 RepID=A0A8B6D1Z2_MYTGA|nr:Hypothetical predicted protein [Mytilus galloprovincialis]